MSFLSELGKKASNALGMRGLTLRKAISATAGNIPVVGGVVKNVVDAIEAKKQGQAKLSWGEQVGIATATVQDTANKAVTVLSVAAQAEQQAQNALTWLRNPVTIVAGLGVAFLFFSRRAARR